MMENIQLGDRRSRIGGNYYISRNEFLSEVRREYSRSELLDLDRELRPEIRQASGAISIMTGARLFGPLGALIMALREGLTVRGYYNPSVSSSITLNGSNVSQMSDLHTSGNNYVQGTAGNQPPFTSVDGSLKSKSTIQGYGNGNDILTCVGYSTPVPGTTPVFMSQVINQNSWTTGKNVWVSNAVASSCNILQSGVTPQLAMNSGAGATNLNGGLAVGSWGRVEAQFTNSASDYLKCVSTNVTGASAGNTGTGVGRRIFNGTSSPGVTQFAWGIQCEGTANSRYRSFQDWWITVYFGSGLV